MHKHLNSQRGGGVISIRTSHIFGEQFPFSLDVPGVQHQTFSTGNPVYVSVWLQSHYWDCSLELSQMAEH